MKKEVTEWEQALLDARREESEALAAWADAKSTGIDLDKHQARWLEAQQKVRDLLFKVTDDARKHLDEGI